jgi:hypothetical protein
MWIQRKSILMLFEGCLRSEELSHACLEANNFDSEPPILASSIDYHIESSRDTPISTAGNALDDVHCRLEVTATSPNISLRNSHVARYLFDILVLREICTFNI